MYPIFPVALINGRKVPLIKDWANKATTDPDQIAAWQNQYRDRIKIWGVPTGSRTGILALDVDVKTEGFKTLQDQGIQLPDTRSQRTLSGGMHYLYQYPTDGELYANRIGFMPGLDVRGEGGFIGYYAIDDKPMAPPPEFLRQAAIKRPIELTGETYSIPPEMAQRELEEALQNIREAPEGASNETLNKEAFRIGQLVAAGSYTKEQVEPYIMAAAIERKGEATRKECEFSMESGLSSGMGQPRVAPFKGPVQTAITIPDVPDVPDRWTPAYFTTRDLTEMKHLKKPQLFKDWSTEDIHITTADGGTGKTTLKLYESVCLALGLPFLGFQNKQRGKTLYITGEDTAAKLGAMVGMIAKEMNVLNDDDMRETLLNSIVVKKDSDLTLIDRSKATGFMQPNLDALNKVMQAVEDIQPKLIVFDPISSFWGSEIALNDMAKAVGKFMNELVIKSGACVEMINHMGKQSSSSKDMSQFAGRGGTGLPSNARVSRVIRSVGDKEFTDLTGQTLEEKESALMINVNKFSDGSPLLNKPFLVVRKGFTMTPMQINKTIDEEDNESDIKTILNYIREVRKAGKYPTQKVIEAHFTSRNLITKAQIDRVIASLEFEGYENQKLTRVDNPDQLAKDPVFIITDPEGREIN